MGKGLDKISNIGDLGGSPMPLTADPYVDGGNILVAKLISTLLGAVWLTTVAGWIAINHAIVTVHLRLLDAMATMYIRVIRAVGVGGAKTLRESWRAAFLSATATSELFAPLIFTLEIVFVSAVLLWARQRWF